MRVRELRESDIPILKASELGFPYPNPLDPMIKAILVVADDDDNPILTVAAKGLIEVFGWFSPTAGAELRLEAVRAIHGPMIEALKRQGYDCAEVFVPPQLERRGLGRILRDRFGWHRNWSSYIGKHFGL